MNIVQEDNSNISEFLKNLWLNNLQFIILKFCRFCLFVTFVFILLLLYTQMFLILSFSWLEKKRKKQFKSQPRPPLTIKIFTFVQPCLLFHPPPPPPLIRLLVFDIFPKPLRFHIPHILETREYKGNKDFQNLSNKEIYFTLQSNSAKWYKKLFKFISWPKVFEGHHILSQESFDGYILIYVLSGIHLFIFLFL